VCGNAHFATEKFPSAGERHAAGSHPSNDTVSLKKSPLRTTVVIPPSASRSFTNAHDRFKVYLHKRWFLCRSVSRDTAQHTVKISSNLVARRHRTQSD
jgi:hypothetical protein